MPRLDRQALAERHREFVRGLLGDLLRRVDLVPDPSGRFLSLRVRGLAIARVEGDLDPRVYFGLEGNTQKLDSGNRTEFRALVEGVLKLRKAPGGDTSHEFYRLQGERWLESLLIGDISKIDPALSPDCVYPQVPAFSGPASSERHRGVIDVLGTTRGLRLGTGNRLAVIELKLCEEDQPASPRTGLLAAGQVARAAQSVQAVWLLPRDRARERAAPPLLGLSGISIPLDDGPRDSILRPLD